MIREKKTYTRPRFNTYRAAHTHWGFGWNQYYEATPFKQTIGLFFQAKYRVFGVRWAKPGVPRDHGV